MESIHFRSASRCRRIAIVAPSSFSGTLAPLKEVYEENYAVESCNYNGSFPHEELLVLADHSDAILVIGPGRRSPRTMLPGPIFYNSREEAVPVGWIPDRGKEKVSAFVSAAATVHKRSFKKRRKPDYHNTSIVLLGQWNKKYLYLTKSINRVLTKEGKQKIPVFLWTSDNIIRDDMLRGLTFGLSMAMYLGHGRPIGWVGYRGTRKHHFNDFSGEPLGVLFSLTCLTASRRRTGISFSEAIPLLGVAAAAFGAVTKTNHADNIRWGVRLSIALRSGCRNVGELVVKALPPKRESYINYRIIGDPVAPLYDADRALKLAQALDKEIAL